MSQYIRPAIGGASVFFTVTLAVRGGDILVREIDRLRDAVARVCAERPFVVDAWVVLPDHLHCVWTLPEGDADYSVRWGAIKGRFSRGLTKEPQRSCSKIAKGEKGIWQRRFWEHHIRDQRDFDNHVRYCWINPVKHRFVERAVDWPYSSVHRDIRLGRIAPEWPGDFLDGNFGEP